MLLKWENIRTHQYILLPASDIPCLVAPDELLRKVLTRIQFVVHHWNTFLLWLLNIRYFVHYQPCHSIKLRICWQIIPSKCTSVWLYRILSSWIWLVRTRFHSTIRQYLDHLLRYSIAAGTWRTWFFFTKQK